ncbi:hypothetical protein [Klebsiella quasipneumoniae]|jgi:hypothetical protein|uniref:hypothetical protein n=1 Tax=Klebsiella quasipneumoniae TaxID=1463165 RepID=UPI003F6DCE17
MTNDKKDSRGSAGLVIRGGGRNTFNNFEIYHEPGITAAEITDTVDSNFLNFKIISIGAVKSELNKVSEFVASLPEDDRERISRPLTQLKSAEGKNFVSAYKNFMSSLGDHVTVITPLMPYIMSLIPK